MNRGGQFGVEIFELLDKFRNLYDIVYNYVQLVPHSMDAIIKMYVPFLLSVASSLSVL